MSYTKTVAVAIGLCFVAAVLRSVVLALLPLLRSSGAAGLAFVWGGVIEVLIGSLVLGWLREQFGISFVGDALASIEPLRQL